jgi:hypothetical protein
MDHALPAISADTHHDRSDLCTSGISAVVTNELLATQVQAGFAAIQAELAAVREEQALTNRKIGTLAESMLAVSKRLGDLGQQMRMVALAVGEHTSSLDQIEKQLHRTA